MSIETIDKLSSKTTTIMEGLPAHPPANSTMPHVSVIIPSYNQAGYVGDAIRSVLQQTYGDYEIIVVDDGSTDNTYEVVAEFGDQVRCIRQENKGLAGARNTGILASRGRLIGLLDADDKWMPCFLETMLALVDKYPESTLYYSAAQAVDENGRLLPREYGSSSSGQKLIYDTILRANFLIPSTILLRRSALIEVGLFDEKLRSCEDWDLWLRMLPKHSFVSTSERLVYYRLHSKSLSANPVGMQKATKEVINKHFGLDDGNPIAWTREKRRAYGGVYRYNLLTSVQRQDDWEKGADFLCRALQTDPTLAMDFDLFYDLVLGTQPVRYRGTANELYLEDTAVRITEMLTTVFDSTSGRKLHALRAQTFGSANFAFALIAYNTGQLSLSRRFNIRALRFRPDLIRSRLLMGNLARSLAGRSGLRLMRWAVSSFTKLAHR